MAYGEGQLNGEQDYRVGLEIWYSGTQNGSQSLFHWNVRLRDWNQYGSWTGGTSQWYTSIGGVAYGGTFTMSGPIGFERIVASGSTWISHDANGYRPGFASDAYMIVPHHRIGEGSSGGVWVDAPRITRRPYAPTPLGLDQITTSSMRYRFQGNDDGGSGILEWRLQYSTDPAFATYTSMTSSGTSTVPGLAPSTTYYFRSQGRNAHGWGDLSAVISAKTLAALFYIDPETNIAEPVTLYFWNGSAYELIELLIDPELDGTFVHPVA